MSTLQQRCFRLPHLCCDSLNSRAFKITSGNRRKGRGKKEPTTYPPTAMNYVLVCHRIPHTCFVKLSLVFESSIQACKALRGLGFPAGLRAVGKELRPLWKLEFGGTVGVFRWEAPLLCANTQPTLFTPANNVLPTLHNGALQAMTRARVFLFCFFPPSLSHARHIVCPRLSLGTGRPAWAPFSLQWSR